MKSLKILLTALLIATLLIVLSGTVFATEANPTFIQDSGNNTVNNTTNNTTTNTTNNTTNNTTTNTTNTNTSNVFNNTTNSSVYNNTSNTDLPYAGTTDNIVVIAIAVVFGISALYAFKKIREYNV